MLDVFGIKLYEEYLARMRLELERERVSGVNSATDATAAREIRRLPWAHIERVLN